MGEFCHDAYGKTRQSAKPSRRHAALVVSLAGGISAFLLETLEAESRHGKGLNA